VFETLNAWARSNGTDAAGGLWEVYAKSLAHGATAALLLSRNASAAVNITLSFAACNVRSVTPLPTNLLSIK
jgi:hypothetical protein